MLDLSDPKKRERTLLIFAGMALCVAVAAILPAQFRATAELRRERIAKIKEIEDHERLVQNRVEIRDRLTAFENQALAAARTPPGTESVLDYQNWLMTLATGTGLQNLESTQPSILGAVGGSGGTGGYTRHTFSLTGEGRLEQIAEFLRRFHRTEYLHAIQNLQPRPIQNQQDMLRVTFRIEALSLPQVSGVNTPTVEGVLATDEESQLLSAIRDRAILSEYRPPAPPPPRVDTPPVPPFDHIPFYYVDGITEADGVPRTWINHRTGGGRYFLSEGESLMIGDIRCTVRKIDFEAQLIQIEAAGSLLTIRVGKNFDEPEDVRAIE
ncbi:MAG: hypothetical protein FWG73_02670 [Planctomycetaceae bacterium]|nr:hypothetical protein [Planctomycetaceae bacterium]